MAVRSAYNTSNLDLAIGADAFQRTPNDVSAVQFGNYDVAAPTAPVAPPAPKPAVVQPLRPSTAGQSTGQSSVLRPGDSAQTYALRLTQGGYGVYVQPLAGESAEAFKARNDAAARTAAKNAPANNTSVLGDAGIIGLDLARTATNPTRILGDYLPPGVQTALNPVGSATEAGIAAFQGAVPGAGSSTGDQDLLNVIRGGPPVEGSANRAQGGGQPYQPQTGTGGSGAGSNAAVDNAIAMLNAPQAAAPVGAAQTYNGQTYSGDSYSGQTYAGQTYAGQQYNPVAVANSGAGYVAPTDYGFGNGYIPYQDQGAGTMIGYTGESFNEAPLVGFQNNDPGNYGPLRGAGDARVEDVYDGLQHYTGQGNYGEDPLLGYIPYTEEEGPSKAEALLTTALERAQANTLGQAAMARGGPGAVAAAQREARGANSAAQGRAGAELAAMRADETERRQQRLMTGEIAARGRQEEESTAQRNRLANVFQTQEGINAQTFMSEQGLAADLFNQRQGRASAESIAGQDRATQELMNMRGIESTDYNSARAREVAELTAQRERQSTERTAGRQRELDELLALDQRQMTGEIAARGRESDELIARGNALTSADVAARNRASTEAMSYDSNRLTAGLGAQNNSAASAIAALNATNSSQIAAQNNSASSAMNAQSNTVSSRNAALNATNQSQIAAQNNTAQAAAQTQLLQFNAQNDALQRQLQGAVASGNIQSQQLIQDKINQNEIDRLYLQDQLGTPTLQERLYGAAGSIVPIAAQALLS